MRFEERHHTFHSFRATALVMLTNAKVPYEHSKILVGHKLLDVTGGYLGANPLTPAVANEEINRIIYPWT